MSCFRNWNCGCGSSNNCGCQSNWNNWNNCNRCNNSCVNCNSWNNSWNNCNRSCCHSSCSNCSGPFWCPRLRTVVIRGPRGFPGPQGPQGPQGIPGTSIGASNAFFTSPTAQTIAAGADIPLVNNIVLNGTDITHTAGSSTVTLNAGTYLINWTAAATIPAELSVSAGLTVNGVVNTNSQSTATGTAGNVANLSGSAIINVTTPTQITLRNLGGESTSFQNVSLSIVKLN